MAAATEAQAEGPAPPPPRTGEAPTQVEPSAAPVKRAPVEREEDEDGDERRPERKRRRARVAALESVPRAAKVAAAAAAVAAAKVGTASTDDGSMGDCDSEEGFTFNARSFSGVETTPKFGSFNPGAAEFVALHPRCRADSAATEETTVAGGGEDDTAEGSDGNSR